MRYAIAVALMCLLALGLLPAAARANGWDAMDVWGSVDVGVQHRSIEGVDPQTVAAARGRVEIRAALDPWIAFWVLEPQAQAGLAGGSGDPSGSIGVTEGFVGYRTSSMDISAGRLSLPIETARLTVPYTLMPPDEAGRKTGRDGLRADFYWGSSRAWGALVNDGDHWMPVASLRHHFLGANVFSGWEAAAHLVGRDEGVAAGLGWSGLVGSTVVYGESWKVPGEGELRYALGASGYLGDALWTGEVARAPLVPGGSPGALGTDPSVFLAALQLSYAPASGLVLTADATVELEGLVGGASDPAGSGGSPGSSGKSPAHHWGVAATYELVPGQSEVELSLRRLAWPGAPATVLTGLGWRFYF